MIFPPIRISELKSDTEIKKKRLHDSTAGLRDAALSHVSPMNFLKHPGWILGGIFSGIAAFKFGRQIFGAVTSSKKKGGWTGRIMGLVGALIIKQVFPIATKAVLAGFQNFFGKFDEER